MTTIIIIKMADKLLQNMPPDRSLMTSTGPGDALNDVRPSYTQLHIIAMDEDGFQLGPEEADDIGDSFASNRYVTTGVILAGTDNAAEIATYRLVDDLAAAAESQLARHDGDEGVDDTVQDTAQLVLKYVRPEQDLLELSSADHLRIATDFTLARW